MPDHNDVWTVRRTLDWIEGYLVRKGDESPRVSAQWLVSEALGVTRMQLFLDGERPLSNDERALLREWTRRRGAGEPLQYITGEVAFRHITVKVRKGVLIPRPETEVLVSEALALLPPAPKPQDEADAELIRRYAELSESDDIGRGPDEDALSVGNYGLEDEFRPVPQELLVADVCTGTGCIACSIAHEHPGTTIIATDIASEAVSLAKENVRALGLEERVHVLECDLAQGIDPQLLGTFDLVVSNPPYVPSAVLGSIPREVADFEPALALDGGPDGLDTFRRLVEWCSLALAPGGAFAFELHETCLDDAAREASDAGFDDVRIVHDLANRPRVLTARKPALH